MGEVLPNGGCFRGKIQSRYVFAILASIGMGIIYGLKVGLHVTIVTMVNHTATDPANTSLTKPQSCNFAAPAATHPEDGPFAWSNTVQGYVLSSYFWGYLVAQLPGGRIAEQFSAKWVFFFAVAINIVAYALAPLAADLHYGALILLRVLQGVGGGVTFPACHVLLAHWAPPLERSFMSSLVYAGTALGTVVSMLASGLLADRLGWRAAFYAASAVSTVWLLFWAWLVQDTPAQQAIISVEERDFITRSLDLGAKKAGRMPWRAVLGSAPFWAILVAHTCSNWGWYTVLIELPLYMKNVLGFKINENGLLTALPFLIMWIFSMILSRVLDALRAQGKIGTTGARKIATLVASIVPTICFILLCIIECDRVAAVVLMTVATTAIGGMFCGFLSNHIDISPQFAGTLIAITNTIATIPGIVVPVVVGKLTDADPSAASWRIVFYITIVLYMIEIIFYSIFASGDVQKWNQTNDEPTEDQPLRA